MNEIYTRRSVRQFKELAVENEKIEKLLRAAMQAPSAKNQQPWEFIVVDDKQKILEIEKFSPFAKMLNTAPVAIVILEKTEVTVNWLAHQDLGAATQNLLLEAVNLDLGTCWLGVGTGTERDEYLTKLFNLPATVRPFAVIAVGYPERENANSFVDRFDETRVHHNSY